MAEAHASLSSKVLEKERIGKRHVAVRTLALSEWSSALARLRSYSAQLEYSIARLIAQPETNGIIMDLEGQAHCEAGHSISASNRRKGNLALKSKKAHRLLKRQTTIERQDQ